MKITLFISFCVSILSSSIFYSMMDLENTFLGILYYILMFITIIILGTISGAIASIVTGTIMSLILPEHYISKYILKYFYLCVFSLLGVILSSFLFPKTVEAGIIHKCQNNNILLGKTKQEAEKKCINSVSEKVSLFKNLENCNDKKECIKMILE